MKHFDLSILRQGAYRHDTGFHAAVVGGEVVLADPELEKNPISGYQAQRQQAGRDRLAARVELGKLDGTIRIDHRQSVGKILCCRPQGICDADV